MVQKRNIGLAVLLSIVTCGIYVLYWMVKMTDEVNTLSGEEGTSGMIAVLLTVVTGGLYIFYWNYKMARQVEQAQQKAGVAAKDNTVLYEIFVFLGLQIVTYCMIQADINKLAE